MLQATEYFLVHCLPAFTSSMQSLGFDNQLATASLKVLVLQETAPEAGQNLNEEISRAEHGGQ